MIYMLLIKDTIGIPQSLEITCLNFAYCLFGTIVCSFSTIVCLFSTIVTVYLVRQFLDLFYIKTVHLVR